MRIEKFIVLIIFILKINEQVTSRKKKYTRIFNLKHA